jgi:arginine:agmatine antiporter
MTTDTGNAAAAPARQLGPVAAGALVASNMIGSGVFLLPLSLAAIGSISLLGWLAVTVGVMVLALVFSALARLRPAAPGLTGYVREGVGPFFGLQSVFLYWLSCWVGSVAIAIAAAGYLAACLPQLHLAPFVGLVAIAILAVMTLANLVGPRFVTRISGLTIVLGLLPVAGVGVAGWFFFHPAIFLDSWNVLGRPGAAALPGSPALSALAHLGFSPLGAMAAVTGSLAQIVWAFLGVESAAVAAKLMRNPQKNVLPATLGGVAFASIVYIGACTAITGILPNAELAKSTAPFADAVGRMWGPALGVLIAGCAAAKAIGAIGGWVLVTAETAETASDTGLFPGLFRRGRGAGPSRLNLLITFVLMTAVTLLTMSPKIATQFNRITNIAVLLSVLVYGLACISLMRAPGVRMGERWLALFGLAFCAVIVLTCDFPTLKLCGIAILVAAPLYLGQRFWKPSGGDVSA